MYNLVFERRYNFPKFSFSLTIQELRCTSATTAALPISRHKYLVLTKEGHTLGTLKSYKLIVCGIYTLLVFPFQSCQHI